MPQAGMTGDLYMDADNPQSTLEAPAPPAPPTDIPPPTKEPHQPVQVRTHRMADERPDGTIRDTSGDALKPSNDLNFRNLSDEEIKKPVEAPPAEQPKEEPKPPEPPKEAPPAVEKMYAGKFKSPDELEKSYLEAQKKLTQLAQEKSELEKKALAVPPAPPPPKTPQQLAAEQEENTKFLNEFVANPKAAVDKWKQEAIQTTQVALQAQQIAESWRKMNPDLAEHEVRVAFEATLLAQSDPELAGNHEALLQKATDNFRQFTGKIRSEGAKEALTQETRTIPLLSSTPAATTEQPSGKAPLTAESAFDLHMRMLKEQEQKSHRGLRR